MTGQEARNDVHWVGDAPTSLHGNGAASFERTTRDPAAVTCKLCLSQLALYPPAPAPEARDDEREAWTPSTEQVRSHYVFNQSDRWDRERGEAFDRWLAAHDAEVNAARKHPEPEITEEMVERAADALAWEAEHEPRFTMRMEMQAQYAREARATLRTALVPLGEGER